MGWRTNAMIDTHTHDTMVEFVLDRVVQAMPDIDDAHFRRIFADLCQRSPELTHTECLAVMGEVMDGLTEAIAAHIEFSEMGEGLNWWTGVSRSDSSANAPDGKRHPVAHVHVVEDLADVGLLVDLAKREGEVIYAMLEPRPGWLQQFDRPQIPRRIRRHA